MLPGRADGVPPPPSSPPFHPGVSAETHLLLEQAFCGHDPLPSAAPLRAETAPPLLTSLGLLLLLTGGF